MNIEVTCCHDCPFCSVPAYEDRSCNHPGSDVCEHELTDYNKTDLPNACPLRKGETIVKIKI